MLFDTTQNALEAAISGAATRQQALAANLANANTPGYQRVDVDFHSSLAAALGSQDAGEALHSVKFAPQVDAAGATRADGSSVDVDAESAKLSANGLEYEQLAAAAKTRLDILRTAMGVA